MNIYETYMNALESADFELVDNYDAYYDEDDIGEEAFWKGVDGEITAKDRRRFAKAEHLEALADQKPGSFLSNMRLERAKKLYGKAANDGSKKANNQSEENYARKRMAEIQDKRAGVKTKEQVEWETRGKYAGGMTEKDLKNEQRERIKRTKKTLWDARLHDNPYENNKVEIDAYDNNRNRDGSIKEAKRINKKKKVNNFLGNIFNRDKHDREKLAQMEADRQRFGENFEQERKRNATINRINRRNKNSQLA